MPPAIAQSHTHLSFDCYGTLIDWESGILSALTPFLAGKNIHLSNEVILNAYSHAEQQAESNAHTPHKHSSYKQILRTCMHRIAVEFGFQLAGDDDQLLLDSLPSWPAFPDTLQALQTLQAQFQLVIISNVDKDLFAKTQSTLQTEFHRVITAEDAQAYKPSTRVFNYALTQLSIPQSKLLHVAQSRFHDIAPANALGICTIHVDRRHDRQGSGATPASTATADYTVNSLSELVELLSG